MTRSTKPLARLACFLLLCAFVLLTATPRVALAAPIRTLHDLSGRKVATNVGTIFQQTFADMGITAEFTFYDKISDALAALREGKVDAYVMDEAMLHMIRFRERGFRLVPPVSTLPIAFAVSKDNEDFAVKADEVLKKLKESGDIARLWWKWLSPDGPSKTLPEQTPPRKAPVLRLGVESDNTPFAYMSRGKPAGLEVEVAQRVADKLGMRLEIQIILFDDLLPMLLAGKVDMVAGSISVTPERAQNVRFLYSVVATGMAALVKDGGMR